MPKSSELLFIYVLNFYLTTSALKQIDGIHSTCSR